MSNASTMTSTSPASSSPTSPSLAANKTSHQQHKRRRSTQEIANKELVTLCNQLIKENDHLKLALIARQRGIPPSLRAKVWPILLKYHPYVLDPFINATVEKDEDIEIPEGRIHYDLMKYFRVRNKLEDAAANADQDNVSRTNSPPQDHNKPSPIEQEIIRILEASIVKFFKKWGAIIKYDSGFAWIALNLAEWLPPITNSSYVLIGRDIINKFDPVNKHLTQLSDPSEDFVHDEDFKLDNHTQISTQSSSSIEDQHSNMTFAEVYERLVLVLLHSHENINNGDSRRNSIQTEDGNGPKKNTTDLIASNSLNEQELMFKSGNIENRISFFLVALAKLLPELYKLLSEEEIINNNSNKNNQWLTWWFKYCGAKVLNKFDRGRIWDVILGFRFPYKAYVSKYENNPKVLKRFKKFYDTDETEKEAKDENAEEQEILDSLSSDVFWYKPIDDKNALQWSQIDYQLQIIFIFISILQKNESNLLEFDQSEINEFLNKLPLKKSSSKHSNGNNTTSNSGSVSSASSDGYTTPNNNHNYHYEINLLNNTDFIYYNDFEKVLKDSGDLWRNWLWNEIRDEIND